MKESVLRLQKMKAKDSVNNGEKSALSIFCKKQSTVSNAICVLG